MEVALSESNEFLEKVFSVTHVLIAHMDTDFDLLRVNRAYADILGLTPETLVGRSHFDFFPDEEAKRLFEDVIQSGQMSFGFEKEYCVGRDGAAHSTFWDWNLFPITTSSGVVDSLVLSLIDVTHRKHAEEALDEVERRFQAIFNQTFQSICLLDAEGIILEANETFTDLQWCRHDSVLGRSVEEVLGTGLNRPMRQRLETGLRSVSSVPGRLARMELQILDCLGEPMDLDVSIKTVKSSDGAITHLIFEGRDITDRKRAEEIMKRNADRAMLLSEISEILLHVGPNCQAVLRTVAESSAKLFGDVCVVRLLSDVGEWLPTVAWSHQNPEMNETVEEVLTLKHKPATSALEGRVVATGQSLSVSLSEDEQTQDLVDSETRLRFQRLGIHSALVSPLWNRKGLLGTMTILRGAKGKPYDEDDRELLNILAYKASLAIENAQLYEEISTQRAQLRSLSRRMVQIQEMERRHIARELHDEAGQTLASLMVGLGLLERQIHQPDALIAHIAKLKSTLENVVENLHRLGVDLRPPSLDLLGLVPALQQHVQMIESSHGIQVRFESLLASTRLPHEMETSLYRIVQEALTNVIRHANATSVDILLERRDGMVTLVVEDNGIGFDFSAAMNSGRLGLLGMRERVEMMDGKLVIETALGKGTVVQVEVPHAMESLAR